MALLPTPLSPTEEQRLLIAERLRKKQEEAAAKQRIAAFNQGIVDMRTTPAGARQYGYPTQAQVQAQGVRLIDSNLPDYSTPGYDNSLVVPSPAQQAQSFVADNPQQAVAGQQFAQAVADRAVQAGLTRDLRLEMKNPPQPSLLSGAGRRAAPEQPRAADAPLLPPPVAGAVPQPVGAPAQSAEAPEQSAEAPATNGFLQTGIPGVVGRVGAGGVQEFSNMTGDVQGAGKDQFRAGTMGNGVGTLTVLPVAPSLLPTAAAAQQDAQQGGIRVIEAGGPDRGLTELTELMSSENPFVRRAAREQLGLKVQERMAAAAQQADYAKSLAQASLTGQYGVQQAEIQAGGNLRAATATARMQQATEQDKLAAERVKAEAGLQQAQIAGEYDVQRARAGLNPLDVQRAAAMRAYLQGGKVDPAMLAVLTGSAAPAAPQYGSLFDPRIIDAETYNRVLQERTGLIQK